MSTSKPLFVYLQRPDTGAWVTVGRYLLDKDTSVGKFLYAPSYVRAGLTWAIDPVNLPFIPDVERTAPRYNGLHDVLRDACPDSWGKMLLQREHGLRADTHDSQYLYLSSNADRWGALAVGPSPKPSVALLSSPRLPQLETLAQELLAIFERRPPIDAKLRKRLVATPSLGGARPKATIQDAEQFWLVKPYLPTDTADVPLLEHFAQQWGRASDLNFAKTVHHKLSDGLSVVRVLRFDRQANWRFMSISGASLLQTEYPGSTDVSRWSYPRLAEELKRIGTLPEDRLELFGRMVFNGIVGNDDDHPRNHAAVYSVQEKRWRLSPAFDVVPNPDETPKTLTMQLSLGRNDISREAILADAIRFGFDSTAAASAYLDKLLQRIQHAFAQVEALLSEDLRAVMARRLHDNIKSLS
ncbi:MAG: type II toxin-antitoxin system HipA family toxin [Burkholderiaceae bacterium]